MSVFQKNNVKNQKRKYESILSTLHLLNQITALSSSLSSKTSSGFTGGWWRPRLPRESPRYLRESRSDHKGGEQLSGKRAPGRLPAAPTRPHRRPDVPPPWRPDALTSRRPAETAPNRAGSTRPLCAQGLPRGDSFPPGRRRLAAAHLPRCAGGIRLPCSWETDRLRWKTSQTTTGHGLLKAYKMAALGFYGRRRKQTLDLRCSSRTYPTDSIVYQYAFFKGIQLDTFSQQYFLEWEVWRERWVWGGMLRAILFWGTCLLEPILLTCMKDSPLNIKSTFKEKKLKPKTQNSHSASYKEPSSPTHLLEK